MSRHRSNTETATLDRRDEYDAPSTPSRRDALIRGVALAAGVGVVLAATAAPRSVEAQSVSDVTLFNGLLSAEYNAIKAYDAGAGILSSPPAADPLASAAPVVLAVAVHFQSQHREHAARMVSVITAAGGTPVTEASVIFTAPVGFTAGVANVIKLAANAEKAAAIAYADTLRQLSHAASAQVVAAIGGVETQHFIVLSLLARSIVAATGATQANAADIVPVSFVAAVGAGTTGLETIADFTFAA